MCLYDYHNIGRDGEPNRPLCAFLWLIVLRYNKMTHIIFKNSKNTLQTKCMVFTSKSVEIITMNLDNLSFFKNL